MRGALSFLGLRVFRRTALLGNLVFIEVAERLGNRVHGQRSLVVRDSDVVKRHDSGKLRDVAREGAHVMITSGDFDADREFGVEIGQPLLGRRLEQLELQAAAEASLIDVGQQRVHLRLVGKLLEQCAEGLFDLAQLLDIQLKVDGLGLLRRVRVSELDLFSLHSIERVELIAPVEQSARDHDDYKNQAKHHDLGQQRPIAGLADIQSADVVDHHAEASFADAEAPLAGAFPGGPLPGGVVPAFASPVDAARLTCMASVNSLTFCLSSATERISMSSGAASHGELSMLRISVETRALDWA